MMSCGLERHRISCADIFVAYSGRISSLKDSPPRYMIPLIVRQLVGSSYPLYIH